MATSPSARTTNPMLLSQVRDWSDNLAWSAFHEQYDARMHAWCRRFSLDAALADELCQSIWIELMKRMPTFRYDPSLGFRGWLKRLVHSRAIDLLRSRKSASARFSVEGAFIDQVADVLDLELGDEQADSRRSELLRKANLVQNAVRARVSEESWLAFWMINVQDVPVAEAAAALGKKYSAVYNACRRVEAMLRAEGERLERSEVNGTSG